MKSLRDKRIEERSLLGRAFKEPHFTGKPEVPQTLESQLKFESDLCPSTLLPLLPTGCGHTSIEVPALPGPTGTRRGKKAGVRHKRKAVSASPRCL